MLVAPIWAAAPPPLAGQEAADCGDRASLIVTVRDDAGTMGMPNATVVLRWTDAVRRPVREAADVTGHLVLCVPRDARRATLWAEFGDASSEEETVVIVPGMRHEVELRLVLAERRTGRLIGQVLDARTRQPVVAAEVFVPDRAERVESNRRGRFVLSALPVGEHELSVRHIGYAPLTYAVMVRQGLTTEAEIALSADPVELAPLVATVERPRRLEIKGFYERKYWGELTGLGTFITEEDIERWRPLRVSHLVSMLVPSVAPGLKNRRRFSGAGLTCPMAVYLDGIRLRQGELDQFVKPLEVGGIEVYKGLASLPAEFGGFRNRCGAVVVWTK
ncbi:MAG: carboxypeptidase regulatory-like domain-containing protein [Gemmatimonadetes bacterium]|nr:carboxypeptidase regulatory-like domain-containing protein [Candidatus Palauibacter australiensis]